MEFNLMILAADPQSAIRAQDAGIERIFYDLEYINKNERQRGRDTVISNNRIDDIPAVREVLTKSKLLVRTNPIHAYTADEIEKAIAYGADILMLPMVTDQQDVETYVRLINGRARVCIMVETAQALARIDKILEVEGIDEIFIGLNDLHISLGLAFMFEVLSGGLVEYIASKCKKRGIPFGFGGIARIGEGLLPSDNILGEHVRLGSSSVILSRAFKGETGNSGKIIDMREEVLKVKNRIKAIEQWDCSAHKKNREEIAISVEKVIEKINKGV
uniref:aldolase/citrate lyase family protein n=1 Tax=Alistipes sp. TaxID=1872444 RepID=UPI004056269D